MSDVQHSFLITLFFFSFFIQLWCSDLIKCSHFRRHNPDGEGSLFLLLLFNYSWEEYIGLRVLIYIIVTSCIVVYNLHQENMLQNLKISVNVSGKVEYV